MCAEFWALVVRHLKLPFFPRCECGVLFPILFRTSHPRECLQQTKIENEKRKTKIVKWMGMLAIELCCCWFNVSCFAVTTVIFDICKENETNEQTKPTKQMIIHTIFQIFIGRNVSHHFVMGYEIIASSILFVLTWCPCCI